MNKSDDLEKLRDWIGEKESEVDHITIPAVKRLAAMLDWKDAMAPKHGDVLPIGWYSVFFSRIAPQSEIGSDGHPKRGDFLPPVPLPRRMFAGRRLHFHNDLQVGDEVRREAVIKDVTRKQGRSGEMVFVTVKTSIYTPRALAIETEQDIVYRREPDKSAPPVPPKPAPGNGVWKRVITPDNVMLFRYSALTYNGHRIHYDHPYVTKTEGYPDLVMNGGLTTLLVFELARACAASPIQYFSSRNVRPMFVNRAITLCGEPSADGKSAKLWAQDDSGALSLDGRAEFV